MAGRIHRLTRVLGRPLLLVAAALLGLGILGLMLPRSADVHAQAGTDRREVIVASVDGNIDAVMARYLERIIDEAQEERTELLILRIDTPGGLLESTRHIVEDMLASRTPIVTFVAPAGARAGSAGTFITAAGGLAAMANATNIGAASPIDSSGDDIGGTLERKVTNDAAAFIRSIAEKRGRNAFALERTVRTAAAYTAEQALSENIVDLIATDVTELLQLLDGREVPIAGGVKSVDTDGLKVRAVGYGFIDNILSFLSNPDLVFLLFTLGGLALVVELWSPGLVGPGVIGVILLLLSFAGLGQLPFHWAGIALLALAILLIFGETQVPGFGVLGIGGAVSLVLGGLFLVGFFGSPDFGEPDLGVSEWLLYTVGGITGSIVVFFGWQLRRARLAPAYISPHSNAAIVDGSGVVTLALAPAGEVLVAGERWSARAGDDAHVEVGRSVRVIARDGLTLIVEPDDGRAEGAH